ncbi:MAG: FkbM family methyltransferase [Oceanicaulis sp.]|nr:FkbM family methyltransferase [Oceanicaulis sp.]
MKLVFYPAFSDLESLSDQYYRALWYLYPLRGEIEEVIFPVLVDERPSQAPAYLDQSLAELAGSIPVRYLKVSDNADSVYKAALGQAAHVILWSVDASAPNAPIPALAGKSCVKVDPANIRNSGSFYLKFAGQFSDIQDKQLKASKAVFKRIAQHCKSKIGYVFGTGPNLAQAKDHDFSDGVCIACNSMVRNRELLERLRPRLIVAADPIFHAGASSYAAAFRAELIEALDRYSADLIVPMRDYHVYTAHLPERFKNRIVGVPLAPGDMPNLDLTDQFHVTSTANVLTLFLLPLATTFFDEIRIFGCDGRPLSEDSYFWKHDKSSQFNDEMEGIKKAHPAFFDIDYNDYYLTHCETLEKWLSAGEAAGKMFSNHTASYIPALVKRSTSAALSAESGPVFPEALSSRIRKVISIDPDALDHLGHYLAYNIRLAEAAAERGIAFGIAGNKAFDTGYLPAGCKDFIPAFTVHSWGVGNKPRGPNSKLVKQFDQEVGQFVEALPALPDGALTVLYMYCGSVEHAKIIYNYTKSRADILVHINLFWSFVNDESNPDYVAKWEEFIHDAERDPRIVLAMPTEGLRRGFARSFGVFLPVAPHPSTTFSDAEARALSSSALRSLPSDPKVLFPGAMRPEKGFLLTEQVAPRLVREKNVKCVVRGSVARTTDPDMIAIMEGLKASGVPIVSEHFSDDEFPKFLQTGDLIVCPYRPPDFSRRTSGLIIDSMLLGLPVVVLENTWLAELVEHSGIGAVSADDPDSMLKAIDLALENYSALSANCARARVEYLEQHSWDALLRFIVGKSAGPHYAAHVRASNSGQNNVVRALEKSAKASALRSGDALAAPVRRQSGTSNPLSANPGDSGIARVVSINPDAESFFGHFLNYEKRLGRALGARGIEHVIAGPVQADREVVEAHPEMAAVFSGRTNTMFSRERGQEARGLDEFESELDAFIQSSNFGEGTLFFMYCGSFEIAAVIESVANRHPSLKFAISLYYLSWLDLESPELQQYWRPRLASIAAHPNIILIAPTRELALDLETKFGVRPERLPHPTTSFEDGETEALIAGRNADGSREAVTILFPGNQRGGKGYGLTRDALLALLSSGDAGMTLQVRCPPDDSLSDDRRAFFASISDRVEVLDSYIEEAAFRNLLLEADIVVLPYTPDRFKNRTSGLLIDALLLGKPCVVVEDTWLAKLVDDYGFGIACAESGEALAAAVIEVSQRLSVYKAAALEGRKRYLSSNSWDSLVGFLGRSTGAANQLVEGHVRASRPAPAPAPAPRPGRQKAGDVSGRRLLLIGNGPSTRILAEAGFHNLPADMDTFGTTAAFRYFERIGWWPTYYALADRKVAFHHRETFARLLEDPAVTTRCFFLSWKVSDSDRMELIPHSSTGSFCLMKALELGYKEIFLIGMEGDYVEKIPESRALGRGEIERNGFGVLNLSPVESKLRIITRTPKRNPNYFFDDYQQKGDIYSLPQSVKHQQSWDRVNAYAKSVGAKIINLSSESKITAFERKYIWDIFGFIDRPAGYEPEGEMQHAQEAHAYVDETAVVAELHSHRKGPKHVMVDVGAHFGTSARYFCKLGWTLYCFEPDSKNRQVLVERLAPYPNVKIDPRAVSDKPATGLKFFTSAESTGISGLHAFRDSHAATDTVDATTVSEIIKDRNISRIDFLKIDVEGFDLNVLKGVPWDKLAPDVVECEFEDAKTLRLGHDWKHVGDYLESKGYTVYVSEWHPIIRYGIPHDWKRVVPYRGCELGPNAWGNFLAFRQDPGFEAVKAAFHKLVKFRKAPSRPHAPVRISSTPTTATSAASAGFTSPKPPLKRPWYAPIGDFTLRVAPGLYPVLSGARRTIWRLAKAAPVWIAGAGVLAALGFLAFGPGPVSGRLVLAGAGLGAALVLALGALGWRLRRAIQTLSAENRRLDGEIARIHELAEGREGRVDRLFDDHRNLAEARRADQSRIIDTLRTELQQTETRLKAADGETAAALRDELAKLRNQAEGALATRAEAEALLRIEMDELEERLTSAQARHEEALSGRQEALSEYEKRLFEHADAGIEALREELKAVRQGLEQRLRAEVDEASAEALKSITERLDALKEAQDVSKKALDIAKTARTNAANVSKSGDYLRERVAAVENQVGALKYPDAPDVFVFFGHHKCGSRFFRNEVFGRIAESTGARVRQYKIDNPPHHYSRLDDLDLPNIDFSGLGENGRDVVLFANATQRSLDKIRRTAGDDWRGLRIIRDPRQVLISDYFHHKGGHDTELNGWVWDQLKQDKPILNELSKEDGILYELDNISKHVIEDLILAPFDDERVLTLRLEDFAADPKGQLARIAAFMKVPDVAGLDFGKTGANPESGPWRNHFTSEIRERFKERYGQALIDLGYEEDMDW